MLEKPKSEKDHRANVDTTRSKRDRIGVVLRIVMVAGGMFAICVMLHRMDVDGSYWNLGFLVNSINALTVCAIALALALVEVCRDVFGGFAKRLLARPAVRSFLREHDLVPILMAVAVFFGACWADVTGLCALWDGVVSDPGGSALLLAWAFSATVLSLFAVLAVAFFLGVLGIELFQRGNR